MTVVNSKSSHNSITFEAPNKSSVVKLVRFRPEHLEILKQGGVSEEAALAAGLRSVSKEEASEAVGYIVHSSGILFPFLHPLDRTPLLTSDGKPCVSVRLDKPYKNNQGETLRYAKSKNGDRLYFSPLVDWSKSGSLHIVEGEKDCLSLSALGDYAGEKLKVIGINGAWATRKGGEPEDGNTHQLHPDFKLLGALKSPIYVVTDSDINKNPHVEEGYKQLFFALHRLSVKAQMIRLLPNFNGDKRDIGNYIAINPAVARELCVRRGGEPVGAFEAVTLKGKGKDAKLSFSCEFPLEKAPIIYGAIAFMFLSEDHILAEDDGVFKWVGSHWELQEGDCRKFLETYVRKLLRTMSASAIESVNNRVSAAVSAGLTMSEHKTFPYRDTLAFLDGELHFEVANTVEGNPTIKHVFKNLHSKDSLCRFFTGYAFGSDSNPETFLKFLSRLVHGKPENIRYMQAVLRLALTPAHLLILGKNKQAGVIKLQHVAVFVGEPGSGKSTLGETILDLLPPELVMLYTNFGDFDSSSTGEGSSNNRQMFYNKQHAWVALSTDYKGHSKDIKGLQNILDSIAVIIKKLFKQPLEVQLKLGLVMALSNTTPEIATKEAGGFLRRLLLMYVAGKVKEVDTLLRNKIRKELGSIYNWVLSMPFEVAVDIYNTANKLIPDIAGNVEENRLDLNKPYTHYLGFISKKQRAGICASEYPVGELFKDFQMWLEEGGYGKMTINSYKKGLIDEGIISQVAASEATKNHRVLMVKSPEYQLEPETRIEPSWVPDVVEMTAPTPNESEEISPVILLSNVSADGRAMLEEALVWKEEDTLFICTELDGDDKQLLTEKLPQWSNSEAIKKAYDIRFIRLVSSELDPTALVEF